jgi:hypothetical protein
LDVYEILLLVKSAVQKYEKGGKPSIGEAPVNMAELKGTFFQREVCIEPHGSYSRPL